MYYEYLPLILGFCLTLLITSSLRPLAIYVSLTDSPSGHKLHQGSIPVVGGLSIFLALVATFYILNIQYAAFETVFFAGLLLLVIGLFDDKIFLSPYTRLLSQFAATLVLIFWGSVLLVDLGHLFNSNLLLLNDYAIPLTVISIIGVINAVNMVDGLDGLAGGLSLVTLGSVAFLYGAVLGVDQNLMFLLLVIAALAGFMIFNSRMPWHDRFKVFLGNGGSMLLGLILAWSLIKFSQGNHRAFSPVVALWIFAVPLLDTVTIMMRRMINGRSPFSPDREHLHHVFLHQGFTPGKSALAVIAIALFFALVAVVASSLNVKDETLFYLFLSVFLIYFVTMQLFWLNANRAKTAD